jgi:MinD-like ATPase involved in chromosome partitioning or flagellar assembly
MTRLPVLVAAAGACWEPAAVEAISRDAALVLHKRCVDVQDLLASAGTGLAAVALVSAELAGLDADSVAGLHGSGVSVVAVVERDSVQEEERIRRLGADRAVGGTLDGLTVALLTSAEQRRPADPEPPVGDPEAARSRFLAVWGPLGAPGRTTVAVGLAAELAARGHRTVLVDADPYGGSVAQHLGVLDEVSGLLVAARAANAGTLGPDRFAAACRQVDERLRVLTGLPRPDRWVEVRGPAFSRLLSEAGSFGRYVVMDAGFAVEDDHADGLGTGGGRNLMTLTALRRADEVLVVGSPDPVGLSRLARALVGLRELAPGTPARVVVNRMRPSLGWSERDITGMVEGFLTPAGVHFLPDDRAAADRALMTGRSLRETGDSALTRALGQLAAAVVGAPRGPRGRRTLRRRRAGAAR